MAKSMEQKLKELTITLKYHYQVWKSHLDTFYSMEQETPEKQEMLETIKLKFYSDDSFNEFLKSVIAQYMWNAYKNKIIYHQLKIEKETTTKKIISKLLNHIISKGIPQQHFLYSASQYKYVCIRDAEYNFKFWYLFK